MPPRPRMLAAAIAAALALGAQAVPAAAADSPADDAATTTTTSRGIEIPAFYTPPSALPGADGALIRSEPLPLALSLPGIDGPLPG
ncbi:triacylglycerol lipase, partial [Streptomyces sp. NPDC049744]